MTVYKTM